MTRRSPELAAAGARRLAHKAGRSPEMELAWACSGGRVTWGACDVEPLDRAEFEPTLLLLLPASPLTADTGRQGQPWAKMIYARSGLCPAKAA
jgi:hypothetical protein